MSTTNGPTMKDLATIVCHELADLGLRSETAGRYHDAQVARLALALLAPSPPPLELEPPAADKPRRGRRPRTAEVDVPASVSDLAGKR